MVFASYQISLGLHLCLVFMTIHLPHAIKSNRHWSFASQAETSFPNNGLNFYEYLHFLGLRELSFQSCVSTPW
ncbi:hypothetical protein CIPAW_03G230600 [Carya illinoinensis]|uniref:Secreted protein n=1 Tax=Carya illinoinensis TaxID=32201 RepID=A0A8T1R6E4_CARIL|nr:hypothetical protein CIPAW_03G230600 [Carya illinoinensis]